MNRPPKELRPTKIMLVADVDMPFDVGDSSIDVTLRFASVEFYDSGLTFHGAPILWCCPPDQEVDE